MQVSFSGKNLSSLDIQSLNMLIIFSGASRKGMSRLEEKKAI